MLCQHFFTRKRATESNEDGAQIARLCRVLCMLQERFNHTVHSGYRCIRLGGVRADRKNRISVMIVFPYSFHPLTLWLRGNLK